MAATYYNMGGLFKAQGDYAKAVEHQEKCLAIEIKNLGEGHLDVGDTKRSIAAIRAMMQ